MEPLPITLFLFPPAINSEMQHAFRGRQRRQARLTRGRTDSQPTEGRGVQIGERGGDTKYDALLVLSKLLTGNTNYVSKMISY